MHPLEKVTIIGSGNWGSAIAKIVGTNTACHTDLFEPTVRQWVYEEILDNKKLTDIINEQHENIKYLKGVKLPHNVVAVSDLVEACKDASLLVFVLPHQFIHGVCEKMKGYLRPQARAISLIKGLEITAEGTRLFSEEISHILNIPCAALSGANIANEVALEQFSESTIGCQDIEVDGHIFKNLFNTAYFRVNVIQDHVGVQLCGALKNVVAVGAGFSDGLGYGSNTKAAIIRLGLLEMRKFGQTFFGDAVQTETFFESCGAADLITTCNGGRNRKVAEAFVLTKKPIEQLEEELLNGQKLQGTLTAREVHQFLSARNMQHEFPLFSTVYRIAYEGLSPENIIIDI
ncbi:glycerol-3-phosphate dehydrogenase [NAD+] [Mycotypha africana]|uniref:glycerol-3-phosphate dehydrogenase [NAD+] n=1 Tax=Mycotypha africana TaxID=64632 RepID=UPI0022FFCFA3|nr:glycerol-3-phosphate dehydrogenase [NAD+] [Mycotypha africana]KAI8988275.1 glycerol-3-phosphate dehydrogenase [NAD+] [Mycotypha africana]